MESITSIFDKLSNSFKAEKKLTVMGVVNTEKGQTAIYDFVLDMD